MPKNIHTPRDELICGAIDRAEELVRSGDMVNLMYELGTIRNHAERMEAKLVSRKSEVEANLMQGQEPVAWLFETYPQHNSYPNWHKEIFFHRPQDDGNIRNVTPLFTAPPTQPDAVKLPRPQSTRLKEEADPAFKARMTEARATLAADHEAIAAIRDAVLEEAAREFDDPRMLMASGINQIIRAMKSKPVEQAQKCQCSMQTALTGDGCEKCNPEYADDMAVAEQAPKGK